MKILEVHAAWFYVGLCVILTAAGRGAIAVAARPPDSAAPEQVRPATPFPVPASPAAPPSDARATVQSLQQDAAPAPLALTTLEQRLKDTDAIGLFTKITLKNQVDELVGRIEAHYTGNGTNDLQVLRRTFDQLLRKVHDLLKSGDPALAAAILNSREAIWTVLTDPAKYAKL